jgi:hypothetical protein
MCATRVPISFSSYQPALINQKRLYLGKIIYISLFKTRAEQISSWLLPTTLVLHHFVVLVYTQEKKLEKHVTKYICWKCTKACLFHNNQSADLQPMKVKQKSIKQTQLMLQIAFRDKK